MITISQLNIYPIKSAKGISLTSSIIEERGFQFDRRWMLIDEKGNFLTQRQHSKLALITVEIVSDGLSVSAPSMEKLVIPFYGDKKKYCKVQIWNDTVQALRLNTVIDEWFSTFLHAQCYCVFMPDESQRLVDTTYAHNKEHTSFADGFPFLLISEASLQYLNTKLSEPILMNRFRPNIVVSDCTPFEEDAWKTIKIGNTIFDCVKPCARCTITTINQETGEKGKEPLKTLAQFRTMNGKILFGQNLLHKNFGTIHIGNIVEILK